MMKPEDDRELAGLTRISPRPCSRGGQYRHWQKADAESRKVEPQKPPIKNTEDESRLEA